MNGKVFGMQILPDQVQVINPAMMLILIPLFDHVIYPCLNKVKLLENPLHRMAIGGIFASLAFLASGTVELALQLDRPVLPGHNEASINIVNALPCNIYVNGSFIDNTPINSSSIHTFNNVIVHDIENYKMDVDVEKHCGGIEFKRSSHQVNVPVKEYQVKLDQVL